MAIQATGRATFTAVEDYDIVFVLNGVRCDTLNFDSVRSAESAVLEADFTNGGAPCVVDRAVLACYDGEGTLMGSSIEVHDSSSAVADGGNLYLSKDCRSISCEIYQGEKRLCARSITVVRNGSGVSVKAVAYKVLNNVDAGAALNWDSVQSQANYPTQKPDKGKYCYVMTIVLYTDGTTTNSVSTSYTPTDGNNGTSVTIKETKVEYAGGDNGTTVPASGWNTSVPQLGQGKFLWTRTTVVFSEGKSTVSYSVGRIGMDGAKGGTTHILYASSANPQSAADVRTTIDAMHQYYGTYQDTDINDHVEKYTSVTSWVLIKGEQGAPGADGQDGTPATVYTIEPFGSIEASGTLKDGSHVTVTIEGKVRAYKITGDSKVECSTQPQCWKMSVGGADYDSQHNNSPFSNNASNNIISFTLTQDYDISSVPGSANITFYKDNTLHDQLASLIVPISLNPGAIQDINTKLGTIQSTTTTMQNDMKGMKGSIETIKQGQGEINLKVQGLGRDGVNMIYGGDVLGLAENKKYQVFQSNQVELKANVTYTVSARMWMNASSSHEMLLVVFDDTWNVLNAFQNFSNTSAQVDGFSFTPKTDVKARVGIYEQDGKGGDPKSYVGVYIDWVRLEKGNLKDDDLKIDSLPTKWTPSLADIEANNLIPDPDFENSTWEMSDGGATRELNNTQKTGTDFMSQYSGDQGTYGIYGLRMTRSGYSGTDNIYDGMQYHVPFQGAADYTLSVFFKNLGNAALDSEAVVEIHPCGADKTRTRGGTRVAINKSNPAIGYVLRNVTRTFPEYETRSSDGKSVKTEWIEVRIFLTKNGDVVVSRLSLAKCSHAIHWNTAALRSTNAVYSVADNLLATGIDIANRKILITSDNVKVRNNKGEETTAVDAQGNLTAGSLTCQDDVSGTVMSIKNGFFSALKGKAGVSLGVDKNGYPCLVGTDPNGNVLWRLGQKYETADQDSEVTMEVVSMKAYGQMNSYAIGEGVILTLNVTNNTNAAITINTSNMHMALKSEFGNYRGNVDVARDIAVGATKQVVLRGTEAIDISSASSTYTTPVGRSVTAVVIYQGDMRLMQDAEYQELEGLRKDSDGNVQYTLPLM